MATHLSGAPSTRTTANRDEFGRLIDDIGEHIDPRMLIGILMRRFWAMAAVGSVVFTAIVLYATQLTPRYTASTSVVIDPAQLDVGLSALFQGLSLGTEAIDTQVEIISSRRMAERVVLKMGLVDDPEFNWRLRDPSGFDQFQDRVKQTIGALISTVVPAEVEDAPQVSTTGREAIEVASVANALLHRLYVSRTSLTYIIRISVETEHPEKSARLANAFADAYMVEQLEAKLDQTQRASDWLEERLVTLREETQLADEVVQRFRAENGLLNPQGVTLTEQEISGVSAQLVILRGALADVEAKLETVRRQRRAGRPLDELPEVLSSAGIRDLKVREAEVLSRQADLSTRYGTRHPQIVQVRREVDQVRAQIDREAERIVASLENQAEAERQRVSAAQRSLDSMRAQLARNNTAQVRLRDLQRNADASRTLYNGFLQRYKEALNQDEEFVTPDARIVSPATIPVFPSFPNQGMLITMGFLAAAAAGLATVVLLESLDRGISTAQEFERRTGVRCIASIPRLKRKYGEPTEYVVRQPLSRYAESLRTIRSAMLRGAAADGPGVIVSISSALPGEGKTATSLSLARVADMSGDNVLVIDCDMRRQGLTGKLDLSGQDGLSEVISGKMPLNEAVVKDTVTGCDVLTAGRVVDVARDMFSTQKMQDFLDRCRREYRLTVLDGAPSIAVAEGRVLASLADGVVYLSHWRKTDRHTATEGAELLRLAGANIVGGALSRVNEVAQQLYSYGYGSNYIATLRKYYTS